MNVHILFSIRTWLPVKPCIINLLLGRYHLIKVHNYLCVSFFKKYTLCLHMGMSQTHDQTHLFLLGV
jgi:hypothetical protein